MTATTKPTWQLAGEIAELSAREFLVSTNQGTYGPHEARDKVGCGDPHFADRNVYESVGGQLRATGPDEGDAPGRMRHLKEPQLAELRKRLAELKAQLKAREQYELAGIRRQNGGR